MVPLPKILASRLVEFFSGVFALSNFLSCLYMVPLPKILASRLVEFFSGVFALSNFLSCLYMMPLPIILAIRVVASLIVNVPKVPFGSSINY